MGMSSKKVVFVFGAGTGPDVGIPIGITLKRQVAAARIPPLPSELSEEAAEEFKRTLMESAFPSIDSYLEMWAEQISVGKYLMAHQLAAVEDRTSLLNTSSWYDALYGFLFKDGVVDESLEPSVVTFNYDRSWETFCHSRLKSTYRLSEEETMHRMLGCPTLHIYGQLGDYLAVPYGAGTNLDAASLFEISENQIRILREEGAEDGKFWNKEFERANRLLDDVDHIVFMGFGFLQENVERFEFDWSRKHVIAQFIRTTWTEDQAREHLSSLGFDDNTTTIHITRNCISFIPLIEEQLK